MNIHDRVKTLARKQLPNPDVQQMMENWSATTTMNVERTLRALSANADELTRLALSREGKYIISTSHNHLKGVLIKLRDLVLDTASKE